MNASMTTMIMMIMIIIAFLLSVARSNVIEVGADEQEERCSQDGPDWKPSLCANEIDVRGDLSIASEFYVSINGVKIDMLERWRNVQTSLEAVETENDALKLKIAKAKQIRDSFFQPPSPPPPSLPPPPRNTIITINGKQLYQDDDGWILLVAYKHVAGQDNALVYDGTAPQSPTAGYSHIWLADLGLTANDVDSVRFYCTSSRHNRVAHWSTSQAIAKQSVVYGVLGIFQGYDKWRTGTTKLDGHNAFLPDIISDGWGAGTSTILTSCPSKGRVGCTDLLTLPFYHWGAPHYIWAVGGTSTGVQWSCDSSGSDQAYDTFHQIWFKKTLLK